MHNLPECDENMKYLMARTLQRTHPLALRNLFLRQIGGQIRTHMSNLSAHILSGTLYT